MHQSVSQMTPKELGEMISNIVEQKLLEVLGDPEEGLEINPVLHKRLVRQLKAVEKGERGKPMKEVMKKYGI
jgi:hypothetical protein